ncbi:tail fiber assembly protein [Kosakonia sp. SOY2]|uniref:tail fiber assembly protein n=1 Tax=Kosakonia sp. SOY2 TaxID=3014557 RepID=UPI0022AC35F2|nr:tail fiber assembly protein [Kosakonia sp. SOY2]MCZ3383899.1 tail fiber assembly protein [Kosakonia sp. SOY2]
MENKNYLFSKTTLAFYPLILLEDFKKSATLPDDAIPVSDDIRDTFNASPPAGKVLATDDAGMPVWGDKPQSALVLDAEFLRSMKIDAANTYMNNKQWPGKAALGRLKGDELAQYVRWLDYLDSLYAVDTSTAPGIAWPSLPS